MSTIERTMNTLEYLANQPEGARVTDLSNAMGVNRAVPHRILAELVELGFVIQDARTERYRATFKLGTLGLRQLETAGITRWAQDELDRLAERTRELVRLAVVTDARLRWVAKAQGASSALTFDGASGAEIVLHATASGKAWLSTLPVAEVALIIHERGLSAQTARTETDPDPVLREIARARQLGYAVTMEEMEAGVNAIAVPVVPPERTDGGAVGTVSIAGPAVRLDPDALIGFAPILQEVAGQLGEHWHAYEYLVALSGPSGPRGTTGP